eukprot:CAMPEP_0198121952 /NCGR_PEP_ID=MMETSP1442-20131203/33528_1 /TAXON_ID= /ORGANISM="Craspedostauros australis, Strain CCMP3328" /LENGTH=288 /DNA_ID=CAMNT_0043780865 /DNA_START=90 /DNA_END=956 /DNA_ORIENTATION=+
MAPLFLKTTVLALAFSSAAARDVDFTTKAHELENQLIEDCLTNKEPHGFYGAFFQPCEFTFRKVKVETIVNGPNTLLGDESADAATAMMSFEGAPNLCSDELSTVVGRPQPLHWFFNMTQNFMDSSDSWDSFSSDDFDDFDTIADKLMLFPDMCVAVGSRCHAVDNPVIQERLAQYFDEIPAGSTHVEVNCQADAMQLTRVVYAAADGLEKSLPTIIAWVVTVVLLSCVMGIWGCYGCLRLLRCMTTRTSSCNAPVGVFHPIHGRYVRIEEGKGDKADGDEKDALLKK